MKKILLMAALAIAGAANAGVKYDVQCGKYTEVEAALADQGYSIILFGRDSVSAITEKPYFALYGNNKDKTFVNVHFYEKMGVICILGNGRLIDVSPKENTKEYEL